MQSDQPPKPGESIGRFLIQREIGRGASGVTYIAVDTLIREPVALKVLASRPLATQEAIAHVHREVAAVRRVTHKGVRLLFDVHEVAGQVLVAMQLVEGHPLTVIAHRVPKPSPAKVLIWIHGVAEALEAAHKAGVVHGALSARDVLIRADDTPCVLGLGDGSAMTALMRAAPPTRVDDVRALAALIYEGLGAAAPRPPAPLVPLGSLRPEVPKRLDEILARAWSAEPGRGIPTAGDFARELARLLGAAGVRVPTAPSAPLPIPLPIAPFSLLGEPSGGRPAPPAPSPAVAAAHRLDTAPTLVRPDAAPPAAQDQTVALSNLPPLQDATPTLAAVIGPAAAEGPDDSASWVVGGQAIDLPAIPKSMHVITDSSTDPVPRKKKPTRNIRAPIVAAVLLALVGAAATGLALWRRSEAPATSTDPPDAGAPTVADAGAPVNVDGGTPTNTLGPAPTAASLYAAGVVAVQTKGLLEGDDVEVDRLVERLARPADVEDASDALAGLKTRLDLVDIDKKLVTKKLGRLRLDARALTPASRRKAVERLLAESQALIGADRAVDANRKLNESSAALRGAP